MPPRTRPKTVEERLESIEIMLAAILNRLAAAPDNATSMKEFVAAGKAQGLKMVEIINRWNQREGEKQLAQKPEKAKKVKE